MFYRIFISIVISLSIASCCGSKKTLSGAKIKKSNTQDFVINYYTSGGFTGKSDGVTVYSNGNVNYWSGINAANNIVKDSVKINNDEIDRISALVHDSSNYDFKYNEKGNLTTVLTISSGNNKNRITYSGTIVPKEFPANTKNLISELNKLLNKK